MQYIALLALVISSPLAQATEVDASPISKVMELLSSLQDKIVGEAEASQKMYNARADLCVDSSQKFGFEIKTGRSEVSELEATIDSKAATIVAQNSKIEELSASISSDEADLKKATGLREKEAAAHATQEAESTELIGQLERGISVLTKEMAAASNATSSASMLQVNSAKGLVQALSAMVDATAMSSEDAGKLTALIQQQSQDGEQDEFSEYELGAPTAAATESQSGGTVEIMQGLLDKAQTQLDNARKAEAAAKANYALAKQSFTDEIRFANKDMSEAKSALAAAQEAKSVAEGDLSATSKDLAGDIKAKEELHHTCMTAAQEFEADTKASGEELHALATAKKAMQEGTGGSAALDQTSFLQLASAEKAQSVKSDAVRYVRDLAKRQQSPALAQLASRMNSAMRLGAANGADPFKKVRGLITDMLSKLENAGSSEATAKAYCDKQTSETAEKKDEKTTEVQALSTKNDQKVAMSTKIKEEVATLQTELAGMAKKKAEDTQLRQKENALYKKTKPEIEAGLSGVATALRVLRDYYGQEKRNAAEGAGSSIIGLLEVIESDFSKGLAGINEKEETAAADYKADMEAMELETVAKTQDAKYKTKIFKSLDKAATEISSDLSGVQAELDAILEYEAKIKGECTAKAEPYAARKQAREQELAGLKEALNILEGDSLIQRSSKHTLRGTSRHGV